MDRLHDELVTSCLRDLLRPALHVRHCGRWWSGTPVAAFLVLAHGIVPGLALVPLALT